MTDPTDEEIEEAIAFSRDRGLIDNRNQLESDFGDVWDQIQVHVEFTLGTFVDPHYEAVRTSDGFTGTLLFQEQPLYYHTFTEDDIQAAPE